MAELSTEEIPISSPENAHSWRRAFKLSLPVAMGYYPAGIAFGVLASVSHLPWWVIVLMSIWAYAGAAQYAAIPLLANVAGVVAIGINTLVINLRHIFYALPLLQNLPKNRFKKAYCLFALTDETFSVLSVLPEQEQRTMMFKVTFLNQFYWVSASIIGMFLGEQFNQLIPNLDFALACLFAVLLFEQYISKRVWWPCILAVCAFFLAKWLAPDCLLLLALGLCAVTILGRAAKGGEHENG